MRSEKYPHLVYFFLCEKVSPDEHGRINAEGIFTGLLFVERPLSMPPFILDFTSVVCMHSADRMAAYPIKYSVLDPDGREHDMGESEIGFVGGQFGEIQTHSFRFTFLRPGTFWFRIHLRGRLWARYPITVSYMPMSNS